MSKDYKADIFLDEEKFRQFSREEIVDYLDRNGMLISNIAMSLVSIDPGVSRDEILSAFRRLRSDVSYDKRADAETLSDVGEDDNFEKGTD